MAEGRISRRMTGEGRVAIVHDYLTQRGGAERVVLAMLKAFPEAPVHTSLYQPATTFPEFAGAEVRTLGIDRVPGLRRHHRAAFPILAPVFSRHVVTGDVVFCSSSGWAHGVAVQGRKVTYCHTPAHWLYESRRYLGQGRPVASSALSVVRPWLRRWDRRAAGSADRYLANSTAVQQHVRRLYGIESELLPPPHSIDVAAAQEVVAEVEPGFALCVSRLLPYKNVGAVVDAFTAMPDRRLVVAGTGPEGAQLRTRAPANVSFVGRVSDPQLRWLYAHAACVVAAAHEDFGIVPLEAAAFGVPVVALRAGGFLDTVEEGSTGVFFDRPGPAEIRAGVTAAAARGWDHSAIRGHAERFAEPRFVERIRQIADEEAGRG